MPLSTLHFMRGILGGLLVLSFTAPASSAWFWDSGPKIRAALAQCKLYSEGKYNDYNAGAALVLEASNIQTCMQSKGFRLDISKNKTNCVYDFLFRPSATYLTTIRSECYRVDK